MNVFDVLIKLGPWQILIIVILIGLFCPEIVFSEKIKIQGLLSLLFGLGGSKKIDIIEEYIEKKLALKEQLTRDKLNYAEDKNKQMKTLMLDEYAKIVITKIFSLVSKIQTLQSNSNLTKQEQQSLDKAETMLEFVGVVDMENFNVRSLDIYKNYSRIIDLMLIEEFRYIRSYIEGGVFINNIQEMYEINKTLDNNHLKNKESEKLRERLAELDEMNKKSDSEFTQTLLANYSTFIDKEYPEKSILPRDVLKMEIEKTNVNEKYTLSMLDVVATARKLHLEYLKQKQKMTLRKSKRKV